MSIFHLFAKLNGKSRNNSFPARILIIEDSATDRAFIERILRKGNFSVLTAENGRTGVSMALEQKPDLIILDYALPDMNGLEICRILKENKGTHKIPVIFVTVVEDGYVMMECFEAGAENFIAKPVNARQLLEEVALALFESKNEESTGKYNI